MCSACTIVVVSLLALHFHLQPCTGKKPKEAEEFLQRCPPSRCGSGPVEVRYPFRLQTAPPSCGLEGLELTCYGDDALLAPPYAPRPYTVAAVDYRGLRLTVASGSGSACPFQNLTDLAQLQYYSPDAYSVSLLRCSAGLVPDPGSRIAGPVPCSHGDGDGDGDGGFMYVAEVGQLASNLPRDCAVVSAGGSLPILLDDDDRDRGGVFSYAQLTERFTERREFRLLWNGGLGDRSLYADGVIHQCQDCERAGDSCGFSWARNQSFCIQQSHGPFALITGTSIGGFVVLLAVSAAAVYAYRLRERKKEICLKVERFLATYDSGKPTRYSYSDVRRMTKRFGHKLGEGGSASVYKGELPNGVPVAVKMLEEAARGGEEDFANEVATMGRIHHVNVVRLLGFCFEVTTRRYALVYEFMPNGSLEKLIFSKRPTSMRKLHEIAVGVARGVEYLHRGCDQRILHFDIKPHNVLLDGGLRPKVSDFGLAKLCSRGDDIVAMTAARGTMGYAAPEIYLGGFGAVSDKSDVYSFGMLLLEMVSGRRNVDPTVENQAQVYFPEWAYDRLVGAGDLGGGGGGGGGEEGDVAKKLVIVALWCIQWYSLDRPSMTRVVQMLTGSLESLQFPPKPFISSSYQEMEEIVHQ